MKHASEKDSYTAYHLSRICSRESFMLKETRTSKKVITASVIFNACWSHIICWIRDLSTQPNLNYCNHDKKRWEPKSICDSLCRVTASFPCFLRLNVCLTKFASWSSFLFLSVDLTCMSVVIHLRCMCGCFSSTSQVRLHKKGISHSHSFSKKFVENARFRYSCQESERHASTSFLLLLESLFQDHEKVTSTQ